MNVPYYARAVECAILPAISSIASTQEKATEKTERRIEQLLDYLVTLTNTKVRFPEAGQQAYISWEMCHRIKDRYY